MAVGALLGGHRTQAVPALHTSIYIPCRPTIAILVENEYGTNMHSSTEPTGPHVTTQNHAAHFNGRQSGDWLFNLYPCQQLSIPSLTAA
jgi:hypothetical protein